MSLSLKKEDRQYTYRDFLTWSQDERWELIDGIAYNMAPAPSTEHQLISGEIFRQISNYLVGKTCRVFYAPFDVRLPYGDESDEDILTVVQPDIVVACDRSKIDKHGLRGTPDLVMEIISPYTAKKDLKDKFLLYERVGVKEYWIIYPSEKTVMAFRLDENSKYGRHTAYTAEDMAKIGIFEDLEIDLKEVFRE